MQTFRLTLEYDGSRFSGWQEQINARTAAEAIAEAAPPSLADALLSSSVGSQVAHLFSIVEERLAAVEKHLGL